LEDKLINERVFLKTLQLFPQLIHVEVTSSVLKLDKSLQVHLLLLTNSCFVIIP
jgi:hypothetical protein